MFATNYLGFSLGYPLAQVRTSLADSTAAIPPLTDRLLLSLSLARSLYEDLLVVGRYLGNVAIQGDYRGATHHYVLHLGLDHARGSIRAVNGPMSESE